MSRSILSPLQRRANRLATVARCRANRKTANAIYGKAWFAAHPEKRRLYMARSRAKISVKHKPTTCE